MKRHLAVVRCSETSGGGKILFNNVFMSLMLRVGWRTSGNCSNAIRAVASASPMINWSRPVTDPKLTFLELLMVRSTLAVARNLKIAGSKTASLMKVSLLLVAFQRLEHVQAPEEGAITFAPCY
jgi:hypothetical protein